MNYIFFGTPEFAAIVLEKLIAAGLAPVAVVCNPDKPVGRKKIITPPPTKVIAEKNGIKAIQPVHLEPADLAGINFDFFVVAAYGKIIPEKILAMPKLGTIGVHPSILPKYRGATPIQAAILNGEKETGTSLFLMDGQIDHGPILAQREFPIFNLQFTKLQQELAELGGDLLIETLPKFLKDEYTLQPQNDKEATYVGKITADDAYVDLEKDDPVLIERKVLALNPEPGVWTFQDKKRMKILEAELTADGKLKLKKVQFEGGRPQLV